MASLERFFLVLALLMFFTASLLETSPVVSDSIGGPGTCIVANCSLSSAACLLDGQCRKATSCNAGCTKEENVEACNLLCELTYGYNSTKYRALMQCMSDHGCLPVSKQSDGICLANDTDTIKNLTDMSQVMI